MSILNLLPIKFKVWLLGLLYKDIAKLGDEGDTELAHVNPSEVQLLLSVGGSGTINPKTGLREFKGGIGGFVSSAVKSVSNVVSSVSSAVSSVSSVISPYVPALQAVGIGMTIYGTLQQNKYARQQSSALSQQAALQEQSNIAQNKYYMSQYARQMLQIRRQRRLNYGKILGGLAAGGGAIGQETSVVRGSTGSIDTQAAADLSAVYGAGEAQTNISNLNQQAANFGTKANLAYGKQQQYSNLASLGSTVYSAANIFSSGNTQQTTKQPTQQSNIFKPYPSMLES